MKDDKTPSPQEDRDGDIQRLLTLAGPRPRPPEDVEARVRAATMNAFESLPERSAARSPARRSWAIAAALLLSVIGGLLVTRFGTDSEAVGQVRFASGEYSVRGSGGHSTELLAGAIVQTQEDGRLLIGLAGAATLRLDRGTSLTLHSGSEIWLHSGRIYVDAHDGKPLTVVTPYASVTDVGTQFEVAVQSGVLGVAIREGQVDVRLGDRTIRSSAVPGEGEALAIEGLRLVSRSPVPTVGERWGWTQASRPPFAVHEKSVSEFLSWAARESGRTLRFESALASQQADLRRLSGRGEVDADPQSIERVLATTSFRTLTGAPHELIVDLKVE